MFFKNIKKQTQEMSDTFYKVLREYSESLLLAIILALIVRSFILTAYRVPTEAMAPEILPGDFIFSNRLAYGLKVPFSESRLFSKSPKKNDVVVFKCPLDERISCIKRVVAVEGDEIKIESGKLFINSKAAEYNEPKATLSMLKTLVKSVEKIGSRKTLIQFESNNNNTNLKKLTIPKDHFFVLGDYRTQSEDSRTWGAIPFNKLQGRAFVIWFSLNLSTNEKNEPTQSVRWDRVFHFVK